MTERITVRNRIEPRQTEIKGCFNVSHFGRTDLGVALRTAAEVFKKDAAEFRQAGITRSAEHFEQKAKEALALAEALEFDTRFVSLT